MMVAHRKEPRWIEDENGCWVWQLSLRHGYPVVKLRGKTEDMRHVMWAAKFGRIPEGMQLAACERLTHCVNPEHMEVLSPAEKARRADIGGWNRRKTHCPKGHRYEVHGYTTKAGGRDCLACDRKEEA